MLSEQPEAPVPLLERRVAGGTSTDSAQFHPYKPLMMASAGSRAPPTETDTEESGSSESGSESGEDDSDEEAVQDNERQAPKKTLRPRPLDDSLCIWSFA
jgi:hypothetical protein